MNNELYHYGVLGMKWGVRRYQPYGSGGYNPKGKKYIKYLDKSKNYKDVESAANNIFRNEVSKDTLLKLKKYDEDAEKEYLKSRKIEDKIWKESSKEAYEQTYKWFEKNDPDYLNTIIKNNNGSKKNLDAFHDFRKVYEGWEDHYFTKNEKKYGYDSSSFDKKHEKYRKELEKTVGNILGKIGNKPIKRSLKKRIHKSDPSAPNYDTYNELMYMELNIQDLLNQIDKDGNYIING